MEYNMGWLVQDSHHCTQDFSEQSGSSSAHFRRELRIAPCIHTRTACIADAIMNLHLRQALMVTLSTHLHPKLGRSISMHIHPAWSVGPARLGSFSRDVS
eukprot:1734610-Amphidinium_carterae.1